MDFLSKLKDLPKAKIGLVLMFVVIAGMFSMTNRMIEKLPDANKPVTRIATLKGFGDLPSLSDAMAQDAPLTAMVAALSARPATDIFFKRIDVDQSIADILFRWAGSGEMMPRSFGPLIDSRVAGFLKVIGSIPPEIVPGTGIGAERAGHYFETWLRAFDHFRVRLLAQTLGGKIFQGGALYDPDTDFVHDVGMLSEDFIKSFDIELQQSTNSGEAIRNLLDFIDQAKGLSNLSDQEQDMIMGLKIKPSEPGAVKQWQRPFPGAPVAVVPEPALNP